MFTKSLILFAALVAALVPALAQAATVEKWAGTGAEYTPDGKQVSVYEITVVNTIDGTHVHSEATVVPASGPQRVITQDLTIKGAGWTDISSLGKGGGACYGQDICESYLAGEGGRAYATTIVSDGPNARRNLTMVLQNGKAVKVLRDKLARAN